MNNKLYSVMLFDTQLNLGLGIQPNVWINYETKYFDNGTEALEYYANTPCPASQIIDAEDEYELQCKMGDMILNFMNQDWLDKNLYPYI